MVLNPEQIRTFKEIGFVILEDAFEAADTSALERALRRTTRFQIEKAKGRNSNFPDVPEGREFDLGVMALEELDHDFIADISDFIDMSPELLRLSSTPLLHRAAMQLLDRDSDAPSYTTNAGLILAMPFDREHTYGWHKDTYYTLPESRYVQMWAPLVETSTEELGTLEVCVGSHVTGAKEQHAVDGIPNRHRYRVDPEALEKYPQKTVQMTVGQVLLFDGSLAHRSGGNISDRARFSIVSVYHQVENEKIRPMLRSAEYQGKSMDDFFQETCGVIRPIGDDDKHFSSLE